jgi:HAE1 family hydrophobic/amphiphilic exporter-1
VSLSDLSVDRPVTMTMLAMIVVVLGSVALSRLGLDLMPDVDFPTVSVMTRYEGASSEDVEKLITRPLEGAIASVNGVVGLNSVSREDVSFVMVEFDFGTDLDGAAQDLREALGLIEPLLPEDADSPLVVKFSLTALPVLSYTVTGMNGDVTALGRYLDDTIVQRLERLDGVAQVILMGGPTQEVHIEVDRATLEVLGLPLEQVAQAVATQNVDLPGGRVIEERSEYLVRTLGAYRDLSDIEDTVVGVGRTGATVRIKDVARVTRGRADVRSMFRTNGSEALYLMANKQSGANPLQVGRRIKAELAKIQEELPGDISFSLLMDTSSQIENMSTNVSRSGLVGGLLAIVFMFLFLRSVRPTFAIAVAIPLSLLATFLPIYAVGETLNLMTMGGLMLGIGMLVDNAVVVIENIFRHLENGMERKEAARRGAREVGMAITASTLTTVAVFLPLFFGGGLAGELVRGLAMVVAFALAASLLVALTVVPMLASVLFDERDAARASASSQAFVRFAGFYERVLRACLHRRKTTLATVGLVMVLALGIATQLGATFMPASDQPLVMGKASFAVGTPLQEVQQALVRVEQYAKGLPEVQTAGLAIGANEDDLGAGLSEMSPSGVHEAQIIVRLKPNQTRPQADLLAQMRRDVPKTDGMSVEFMDMGAAMMGGGGNKPVQIEIFGTDLVALEKLADRVKDTVKDVEGLTEIDTSVKPRKPERHLEVDRDRAATYGLTVAEIARSVDVATRGMVAGLYREGGDEYPIRVRYGLRDRGGFDELDHIVVPTRAGFALPLRQVAAFVTGSGPVQIQRADQMRKVSVRANLQGRDIASVIADVDTALGPVRASLPSGYRIEFGGTFEEMKDAFVILLGALMLAILLVYMVMASQFEAFAHPLVIMVTMPLALIGVVAVLLVTGTPISVVTFVGVIMLAGIVVNNGIVLVDYINQLRRDGMERREAVIKGGTTRLRAVLITSGTTVAGLLPMALMPGNGAELTADMAKTVAGGLTAATFLTLVVLPVIYELVDSMGAWVAKRFNRALHGSET